MKRLLAALLGTTLLLALAGSAHAQGVTKICAEGAGRDGFNSPCATVIQPQTTATAAESSHVFKPAGPANVVKFQVNTGGSAVWVMVFDATTAPTAGTVTGCSTVAATRPCVAKWYQVAINSTLTDSWGSGPYLSLQTGMVVACSSTGPFTLTYSATCVFSAEAM